MGGLVSFKGAFSLLFKPRMDYLTQPSSGMLETPGFILMILMSLLEVQLVFQQTEYYHFRRIMELHKQFSEPHSERQKSIAASLPILKQQSSNIQRKKIDTQKESSNNSNTLSTLLGQVQTIPDDVGTKTPGGEHLQQPLLSVDISVIDERDDLLLSTSTVQSQLLIDDSQSFCPLHDKPQDIICLIDKVKICCYCALFGQHKDHSFKSQQQLGSQINSKLKQLKSLEGTFSKISTSVMNQKELNSLELFCRNKKKEALKEIQEQYKEIVCKLDSAKQEIIEKVEEQYYELTKKVRKDWEQCSIQINDCSLFREWKSVGCEILKKMKDILPTSEVIDYCQTYQDFPWSKGQSIIKEVYQQLEQFTKKWKKELEQINSRTNSLKNSLSTTLNLDIQSTISLQMDNQTSIQEFHNINSAKPPKYIESYSELRSSKEKSNFRHSEVIQTTLKPIRQSIQFDSRQTRNSTYGLMNKRKSENPSANQWNFSTLMDRNRSNNRNNQTFLSPKLKSSQKMHSPRLSVSKPNPLNIVTQYEKNIANNTLNLSKCGLNDESLIYFVQKAVTSHVPYEINLNRNSLTRNGLIKLLPLLLKAQTVNLAHTGLNDSCLDVLLKPKGPHRLEEINLLENGISLHKNREKVDTLQKMGFKIIIQ